MSINIQEIMDQSSNIIRKRGRPRKNSVLVQKTKAGKDKKQEAIEDDIIVHMSISANDINNNQVNGFDIIQTECGDVDESSGSELTEDENETTDKLQDLIREKDRRIAELEAKVSATEGTRVLVEQTKQNAKNIKIYSLNTPFDTDSDNNIIIPEHTNKVCLWDMHEINGVPHFLPERYCDGKFHVTGWFCSINCAAAYNLSLDDYNMSERHSLLKWMYGKTDEKIEPSPSFRILEKFGGKISIDEYRSNLLMREKDYRIITPPMTFIPLTLEEHILKNGRKKTIQPTSIVDALRHKPRK